MKINPPHKTSVVENYGTQKLKIIKLPQRGIDLSSHLDLFTLTYI